MEGKWWITELRVDDRDEPVDVWDLSSSLPGEISQRVNTTDQKTIMMRWIRACGRLASAWSGGGVEQAFDVVGIQRRAPRGMTHGEAGRPRRRRGAERAGREIPHARLVRKIRRICRRGVFDGRRPRGGVLSDDIQDGACAMRLIASSDAVDQDVGQTPHGGQGSLFVDAAARAGRYS